MQKERDFSGQKYHRDCISLEGTVTTVDVYCVLRAFNVTEPGLQHAIKKLLCAGIRDKGSYTQDLNEAQDAIQAAICFAEAPTNVETISR